MIHQRQGNNDCILATYAMLTGRPREYIHHVAYITAKRMNITWCGGEWWTTISVLNRDYGPDALNEYCLNVRQALGMPDSFNPLHTGSVIPNNYNAKTDIERPDLRGRGSIAVGLGDRSHIVAFENLTIYDGNRPHPVSWRNFTRWYETAAMPPATVTGWLVTRY